MKGRRKRHLKKKGRKGIYLLPNLFTAASLFSGFYAIIAAIQGRYEPAAIAIIVSALCDGLDGRVARLTNTTSHFGVEFDSLADLIAFGVAPAVLAFQWALEPFGRLGWLAAFMYVICGALRLARFNVQKSNEDSSYFKGLPIPAAGCFIASLLLFSTEMDGILEIRPMITLIMIYFLSFLMVSTTVYFSIKKVELRNRKPFNVLVSIILVCMVIAYKPKIFLFFIMLCYGLSGPLMAMIRLYSRRQFSRKNASQDVPDEAYGKNSSVHDSVSPDSLA
jgi:CDP-diacylglycerol---serine O-phosphatidyltransferase